MTEEPEHSSDELEDVELPDEVVEDLDVGDDEGDDVSGGKWSDKW